MYLDVLETVFNVCDGKETEEGLTLPEVMESHCLSHLTSGFGVLEKDIPRHFRIVDENGDGLVSKQEATVALDPLDRFSFFDGKILKWTMNDSKVFDPTELQTILQIATDVRDKYNYISPDEYNSFRDDMVDSLKLEFGKDFICRVQDMNCLDCDYCSYYFLLDWPFFKIQEEYDPNPGGRINLACWQKGKFPHMDCLMYTGPGTYESLYFPGSLRNQ